MAEIRKQFKNISDFGLGIKVVEDKKTGDRQTVTHVSFNVDGFPIEFSDIVMAIEAGIHIDVTFSSDQTKLDGI